MTEASQVHKDLPLSGPGPTSDLGTVLELQQGYILVEFDPKDKAASLPTPWQAKASYPYTSGRGLTSTSSAAGRGTAAVQKAMTRLRSGWFPLLPEPH